MDPQVIVSYHPTVASLTRASMYLLFRTPWIRYVPFFLLALMAYHYFNAPENVTDQYYSAQIIKAVIFILIWLLSFWLLRRSIRRSIVKNPRNLEDQVLIFDNEGFTQEGKSFNIRYPWSAIPKIRETKDSFMIFIGSYSAIPIEKEILNPQQTKALLNIFKESGVKLQLK